MRLLTPNSVADLYAQADEIETQDGVFEQPRLYTLAGYGLVAFRPLDGRWYVPNDAMYDQADEAHKTGIDLELEPEPQAQSAQPSLVDCGQIDLAVWAPDQQTFWSSWKQAGIVDAQRAFTPEYPGIQVSDQTTQGWTPTDHDGNPVPGWHANVRVAGPLVQEFTYGLNQTGENGDVLPLFERTWAAEVFGLTEQPADPQTGFPAGMRNSAGVTYADTRDIRTPTNIIL